MPDRAIRLTAESHVESRVALASEQQGNDFQVVVIGHGPTGAIAASLLGDKNIRTLAIDRQRDVYDKPRAIAIDHEILRLLDNLGVAERVRLGEPRRRKARAALYRTVSCLSAFWR